MKEAIRWSLDASLTAQWSTLFLNFFSLFQTLSPKDAILQTVLWIETIVQIIELVFYTWYSFNFTRVAEMTFYRYHDWFVTTPLMLFSTMVYYEYRNKPEEEVTLESFLSEHWSDVLVVFGFNMLMLAFGYLYEIKQIDIVTSQTLGFAGFAGSFYVIWDKFASKNPDNFLLYAFMFIIWALYGVAAMFTSTWKNASYNILDVFAKNFYGIFLSYLIYQNVKPYKYVTQPANMSITTHPHRLVTLFVEALHQFAAHLHVLRGLDQHEYAVQSSFVQPISLCPAKRLDVPLLHVVGYYIRCPQAPVSANQPVSCKAFHHA
jgi:hypothetical protein